jgi:hypothetical protein
MWLDNASQDLINEFWQRCGEMEAFPRALERPLALALPIALIKLPRLQLLDIDLWLKRHGVGFEFGRESRAVRGCLVAYRGQGLIFLDGTDPANEIRFTIAHEIGHFLVDYWLPRNAAILKFGDQIADVVDGIRPPTISERVQALLGNQVIKVHVNLMERNQGLDNTSSELWQVEDRADRVALGLLAPPEAVWGRFETSANDFAQRLSGLSGCLRTDFGLPIAIAHAYAINLLKTANKGPSWLETLGLR